MTMRTGKQHQHRYLLRVMAIALLMVASIGAGTVVARSTPEGETVSSVSSDVAECWTLDYQVINCDLSISTNQVNLETDLLPLAQQLNSAIDENTTMWLQAWGSRGAKGLDATFSDGGQGGAGGPAQAVTTLAEFKQNYNLIGDVYFYIAEQQGNGTAVGGASTMVTLVAQPQTVDDVLLIGGGGAGGTHVYEFLIDGKVGGHGGSAIASSLDVAVGKGQNRGNPQESGNNVGDGAFGGSQNGPGVGGGNFPACIEAGCVGIAYDGIGGQSCAEDNDRPWWFNGDPGVGTSGQGGDRIRSTSCGGGGYGGGQGGDSFNTEQGVTIWAGAGGGSLARGTTTYDGLAIQSSSFVGNLSSGLFRVVFSTNPAEFLYTSPIANPFSLEKVISNAAPAFVDINGDGLQDLFVGTGNPPTFYFENIGTSQEPAFATGVPNAFGLQGLFGGGRPTFGDIDDDGDYDAFIGSGRGVTVYFENIGTPTAPQFAQGVGNPFGLRTIDHDFPYPWLGDPNVAPTLVDINADEALDMFIGAADGRIYYFENIGTPSAPQFEDRGFHALGLAPINDTYARPAFADVDGDGVQDMFVGAGESGATLFYKNYGTASAPQFLPASENRPQRAVNFFGMTSVGSWAAPAFADLNDDGYPDLLTGAGSGNLWYYEYIRQSTWPEADAPTTVMVDAGAVTEQQVVLTVHGSVDFDASLITSDTVELGDGTARMLRTFGNMASGDVDDDGYPDRTFTFYAREISELERDSLDGDFICLHGITLNGVRWEGCISLEIEQ